MNFELYQEGATVTFKEHTQLDQHQARLLDWTIGLSGEVGEVSEIIKHYVYHNEALNKMELAKEIGDVLWYLSALCATEGIQLEDCAKLNLAKLNHRHGRSYSDTTSADRHSKEEKFTDTIEYRRLQNKIEGSV